MALAPSRDLLGVPSRSISAWSTSRCSEASKPTSSGPISSRTAATAFADALPAVAVGAVSHLHSLELTGRSTRGDGCAPDEAIIERHLHLNRRVPPGIEDLSGPNGLDARHGWSPSDRSGGARHILTATAGPPGTARPGPATAFALHRGPRSSPGRHGARAAPTRVLAHARRWRSGAAPISVTARRPTPLRAPRPPSGAAGRRAALHP